MRTADADPERLAGLMEAVRPVEALVERVTVFANPFFAVRAMDDVLNVPWPRVIDAGLADSAKSTTSTVIVEVVREVVEFEAVTVTV